MKIDDVLESMDGSRPINIPENTENREIFWTLYRGLQAWKEIQDEIKTRKKAIVDAGEADREFTEAKVIIYDGMLDMIGRYIKEIENG